MSLVSAKTLKSAILLIDIQNAFNIPDLFDGLRSNEQLEKNVQTLLDQARQWNATQRAAAPSSDHVNTAPAMVEILHVHHHSVNPNFPLHPSFRMPRADGDLVRNAQDVIGGQSQPSPLQVFGVDPLPCARVVDGEPVFTKNVNSAFIGTSLAQYLQENRIRQLLVCGITTDHCVSTSIRMAANLKVVDSPDGQEQGKIWLMEDACATFQRGPYPADLVHKLHVESLRGEFAEITSTKDVLKHVLTD